MFRIAHISDVHLSPLPSVKAWQLANKRLLGFLNWQQNRKKFLGNDYLNPLINHMRNQTPDHVIISGDIVNLALPKEFENTRKFLETVGDPQDIFVNCGNHDAYVPSGFDNAIKHWQPYMSGDGSEFRGVEDYPLLR